jgi:hypothetical protein
MNALKHGLATPEPILLEGEDEAGFTLLHDDLVDEFEPQSPAETQLVHRLAVAFWKQARANRLEAKLFANTDPPRFITSEGIEPGDPEACFDLRRFNAIRGYQAQLSREVSRCLGELRRLKAARSSKNEPEKRQVPAGARNVKAGKTVSNPARPCLAATLRPDSPQASSRPAATCRLSHADASGAGGSTP